MVRKTVAITVMTVLIKTPGIFVAAPATTDNAALDSEMIPLLNAVNMFSKLPSRSSTPEGSANINSPSIHAKPSSKNGKTKS